MSKLRIGVAGFLHESNTFLGVPTEYENFVASTLTRGVAVVERWGGAHHELGGFLDVLGAAEDVEIVPLLATMAIPSGTIRAAAFERICGEMCEELVGAGKLDGLLVGLHGATVSEEYPDADGEVLRRLRSVVGRELPLVATLDLHANVSRAMCELADALVAYRSNPHLDQRERGREAAELLLRMVRGDVKPVMAVEMPPLVIAISRQHTAVEPARGLYADLEEVLRWPGILTASVTMGFYYADVEEMGAAFLAVADGDGELAKKAARWMAGRAWARRAELRPGLPSVEEAVARAAAGPKWPVVLMDVGDNVGAGSPADSTVLFAEVLRQGAREAMVVLCAPEAVETCVAAAPGARVALAVGTPKVHVEGVVRVLGDGKFVEHQVRHGGWGACDQGVTAVVETGEGHTLVLTSRRMAPMSLEQVLSVGVKPERKKILIVKGVVAPRAAYEPVAAEIVLVDTPGVTSDNPKHFEYQRRRAALYPLEMDARYEEAE